MMGDRPVAFASCTVAMPTDPDAPETNVLPETNF